MAVCEIELKQANFVPLLLQFHTLQSFIFLVSSEQQPQRPTICRSSFELRVPWTPSNWGASSWLKMGEGREQTRNRAAVIRPVSRCCIELFAAPSGDCEIL